MTIDDFQNMLFNKDIITDFTEDIIGNLNE